MEESGICAKDKRQRQMKGRKEKARMMGNACQGYWIGKTLGRMDGRDEECVELGSRRNIIERQMKLEKSF